jgi:SSS family solute:Na+ symporter
MLSQNTLYQSLTFIDWILFFSVLLLTLLSVIAGERLKTKSSSENNLIELLLMGRSLTLPLFVATLVATWYGGIFGVTSLTYEKGIFNFITQGLFWYISYFIFALFLVKKIRAYDAVSLPDIAGKIFGSRAEKVTAILNFFNLLPIAYTISLGLFLKALFGGSLFFNTFIGITIVTTYSLWGGFRAVVFSDLVQFFFMILSVVLVVIFSWQKIGSPIFVFENLPPSHLDPLGGESIGLLLIWGFIALSTLVDPNFYQRCLAAKNERVAKKGIIISIFIWFIFDCCTTLGALYAKIHNPHLNPQDAYLQFSMDLLPSGFRGLMLAGVLATILSTLDSYMFNAATCLSYDFFKNKNKFKIWHHHMALIIVALLSLFIGEFFDGKIVEVWKTLGSFSAASLLIPMLIGQWFPGKIPESRFIFTVITSALGIIAWRILNSFYQLYPLDEFYIGLALSLILLVPQTFGKKDKLS